jgi:mycofactocin biosynthetic radical S-adenosylmethionine protein MftC
VTSSDHLRLGWAFARSLAHYEFGGSARPFSATFAVTNRCNLRCSYCNTPFLDPHQLSLADIELLFRKLKKLGVVRLGLAGGEPLVRDDIGEIVDLAKSQKFWISLNSNLNLYQRQASLFEHVGLVFTSLDGTVEHHRMARGDKSLNGTLEAIRSLRERRIPVVAICVVDTHNVDDADGLLEQAAQLDIRIHFQPRCTDTDIVRGEYGEDLDNEQLRAFWRRLRERRGGDGRIASTALYLEHLADWADFRRSAVAAAGTRCAAGRGFLYIDPQGNAFPCAYTKGKVPAINLLREEWRGPACGVTPCSDCAVGPMVEFNTLFRRPLRAAVGVASSYATFGR